ncbi:pentatricopeptide repeat-containing protein At1g31430 [Primulina tabacum]|uniref:pentatricopeptide repeat-containing protein At1g31430 n=1 Tax=Primulina tabacum TaxID=48773 RepID=UPI003F59444E
MAARSLWRASTKLLLTATVGGGAALGAAAIARSEDPASALKLSTTVPLRLLRDACTASTIALGIQFSTIATTSKIFNKKACIDLLKNCKSMHHFKEIQAQIFIHGLHPNIDILHKLISFSSATNLAYAEKLFAKIEIPTLFIYNVMIKARAKVGSCRKALHLFDELRVRGLLPDNYTYPFVFKALGGLRVVLDGEKIHGFVMKTGDVYDSYICNSILDMYGELGCGESLSKMFDEMPHRDSISWNILISGFVKNNKLEEAINVYMKMRLDRSVKPDEATIASTLSACTSLKRLDLGREIHDYVRGQTGLTVIIGNALLDMYAKCGCLDMARGMFDMMHEKNVLCWTSMVSAYVKCGQLDEATSLFEKAPVRDLILWTTMINGFVQFNKVDEAMALFRNMQMDRVKPDKYTLVALLTGCAQSGALEQGEWIHSYIEETGIKIDVVVGTALIEMYAKCGILDMSLKIFYQMNQKDTASWTAIICAFAMNGSTNRALQFFLEMIHAGIKPDDITFIGVLNACSHGGLVDQGRRYFDTMTEVYQIEPKLEHYGCLIDLLGRAGLLEEAEDVINKVSTKDNKFIVPLYGALLSACRNYENVDIGERISQQILEIESRDSSSDTLMAHIYASASRWDDATKVRRKMTTTGHKKVPGCSAVETFGIVP